MSKTTNQFCSTTRNVHTSTQPMNCHFAPTSNGQHDSFAQSTIIPSPNCLLFRGVFSFGGIRLMWFTGSFENCWVLSQLQFLQSHRMQFAIRVNKNGGLEGSSARGEDNFKTGWWWGVNNQGWPARNDIAGGWTKWERPIQIKQTAFPGLPSRKWIKSSICGCLPDVYLPNCWWSLLINNCDQRLPMLFINHYQPSFTNHHFIEAPINNELAIILPITNHHLTII